MFRFFLILLLLFGYTCFKSIQLNPQNPIEMVFVSIFFFLSVFVTMQFGRSHPHFFERLWFKIVTWIGFLFIGFWATFSLIALPLDVIAFVYSMATDRESFLTPDISRVVFFVSLAMVAIGFLVVVFGPKVVHVEIPIPNVTSNLKDFKIAQISDLHIGPTIRSRYVRKVVDRTNELEPDLIVLTGDLVDAHTESIKRHLQPLADLKAKYGVYYVTGNHEYYWSIQYLLPELEKIGINILLNSHQKISVGSDIVLVAGVPDPVGVHFLENHRPDVAQAKSAEKSSYKATDKPRDIPAALSILLSHRPDVYHLAEKNGFDIQFSGHTHAGQFFPFSLFIPLAHKYYRGLYQHGKLWIYVNPGTGYWGPANRFGIASEITLARIV